jgi:hypothetical protein
MPRKRLGRFMIESLPSEPSKNRAAAIRHLDGRLMAGAAAALLIVTGAFVWRLASPAVETPKPVAAVAPVKNPVLDELVENTKALQISQQEAIDQLQVLQQLMADQRAANKKSSSDVAALSDKLESLRQSFASVPPAPATEAEVPRVVAKAKPATVRWHARTHRVAVTIKPRVAAARH